MTKGPPQNRWTPAEDVIVRKHPPRVAMGMLRARTLNAVKSRAHSLRPAKLRPSVQEMAWSEADLAMMRALKPPLDYGALSKQLGRTRGAVRQKAYSLGVASKSSTVIHWTPEKKAEFSVAYQTSPNVAALMVRFPLQNIGSLYARAGLLGLYRSRVILRSPTNPADAIMAAVRRAVPPGLPPHVRDDVISDMVMAVLVGELSLDRVARAVPTFLKAHNRTHEVWRTVSLDAPMRHDGEGARRIDFLDSEAFHL